ncbi:MAG: polysaccharide biosynthesis tyrosine autokinase [Candidatus Omnitrophota bacterium]
MNQAGIKYYMSLIRKRAKLTLAIIVLFVIISIPQFLFRTPIYRTAASFSIQAKDDADLDRQVKLITSQDALKALSKRVGVDTDKLLSSVKLKQSKDKKNVVELSIVGENPKKVTSIANTWVNVLYKYVKVGDVERAGVPKRPLPGNGGVIILIGVILGIAVSIFLEYLDHTLRTPGGVEFYAKMPFLGRIPPAMSNERSEKIMNMLAHLKPDTLMAEAFRNVKSTVFFSVPEENPLRTIIVSGSILGEGSSFIASNLAITFARADETTLLIDADMQKGTLAQSFEINTDKGLSSCLSGQTDLNKAIVQTVIPKLSLLPAGPYVKNPIDLLQSGKLDELLRDVKSRFPRIVIDVPSVLNYDDITQWVDKCDGVIYVIGSGFTPLKDVLAAREKLGDKIAIVGGILNHVAIERDIYYYSRYLEFYLRNKLWQAAQGEKAPRS